MNSGRPSHYVDPSDFGQAARIQLQQLAAADVAQSNPTIVPVSQTAAQFVGIGHPPPLSSGGMSFTHSAAPPHPCPGMFYESWNNAPIPETAGMMVCSTCYKQVSVAALTDKQFNLFEALLNAIGHFAPAPIGYQIYQQSNGI